MTGPAGVVTREPDGRARLTFRREFADPVDDVWSAITDPDRCARWFGRWTGDARPGGIIQVSLTSEEDGGGPPSESRIHECEPPHRLVVEVGDWTLTVTLAATGTGTALEFVQVLPEGLSPADAGPGWHWYLDRLAAVLSGGPMPDWEELLAATRPDYAS